MIERRKFLTGLISLVAAPAIVRVANIMPVKVIKPSPMLIYQNRVIRTWIDIGDIYGKSPAMTMLADFDELQDRMERFFQSDYRAAANRATALQILSIPTAEIV